MTEKHFLEYVKAVCNRPKMYTPTGTFNEVISFLEGYGSASNVGENRYHSVFTPFRNWIAEKFNLREKIIGWDVFHEVFPSDEEGLKNLPVLYEEYNEYSDAGYKN